MGQVAFAPFRLVLSLARRPSRSPRCLACSQQASAGRAGPRRTDVNADVSYLSAAAAAEVDERLMSPEVGFSLAQLMELAGLAVAQAIEHHYPDRQSKILLCCGSGNNGGDGLVAARHLAFFGYSNIRVCYPRRGKGALFDGLVKQLHCLEVPFVEDIDAAGPWDFVVDGIFGFSFRADPAVDPAKAVRPPFDAMITKINRFKCPVVSIDIPSGWDVENGDVVGCPSIASPTVLVSLTAPKLCARYFTGDIHFCAGRFVPDAVAGAMRITLPVYPGSSGVVQLAPAQDDAVPV